MKQHILGYYLDNDHLRYSNERPPKAHGARCACGWDSGHQTEAERDRLIEKHLSDGKQ